jgi:DNA invertase Pin-like site-specific DNA recombinase
MSGSQNEMRRDQVEENSPGARTKKKKQGMTKGWMM